MYCSSKSNVGCCIEYWYCLLKLLLQIIRHSHLSSYALSILHLSARVHRYVSRSPFSPLIAIFSANLVPSRKLLSSPEGKFFLPSHAYVQRREVGRSTPRRYGELRGLCPAHVIVPLRFLHTKLYLVKLQRALLKRERNRDIVQPAVHAWPSKQTRVDTSRLSNTKSMRGRALFTKQHVLL